jgi:hypothetical protein
VEEKKSGENGRKKLQKHFQKKIWFKGLKDPKMAPKKFINIFKIFFKKEKIFSKIGKFFVFGRISTFENRASIHQFCPNFFSFSISPEKNRRPFSGNSFLKIFDR